MLDTSTSDILDHANSEIHTCDACIDTIEVFFSRMLTPAQFKALATLVSDRRCWLKKCTNTDGSYIWGHRLILQHPSLFTLQQLDVLQRELKGIPSRLDVALNYSNGDVTKSDVLQHVTLKWRPSGPMHDEENGTYWCEFRKGKKRPNRNLLVYDDRINKSTGELDCNHLELRLLRAKVLKANGIHDIADVIALNPRDLFNRHIKWVDVGDAFEAFELKTVRKAVSEDRNRTSKSASEFTDRYRARIKNRAEDVLRRAGTDRAQIVRDRSPQRQMKPMANPLQIPTSLTFPHSTIAPATLHDSNSQNIIL